MPIGCKCDDEVAAVKAVMERLSRDVSDLQMQLTTGPPMLSQQSEQSELDDMRSLLSLSSLEDGPNTFIHMSTPVCGCIFNARRMRTRVTVLSLCVCVCVCYQFAGSISSLYNTFSMAIRLFARFIRFSTHRFV